MSISDQLQVKFDLEHIDINFQTVKIVPLLQTRCVFDCTNTLHGCEYSGDKAKVVQTDFECVYENIHKIAIMPHFDPAFAQKVEKWSIFHYLSVSLTFNRECAHRNYSKFGDIFFGTLCMIVLFFKNM